MTFEKCTECDRPLGSSLEDLDSMCGVVGEQRWLPSALVSSRRSAAESKDFELGKVCTELLRTCLKKDSKDNMTVMIVRQH